MAERVLTIGHSNHPLDCFLHLLRLHSVQAIADVRSQPRSRYATHFDRDHLANALRNAGFEYVYLGAELGGRPRGESFYDSEGHVLYDRVAASREFQEGLRRLQSGMSRYAVAVLCAEEDPSACHRRLLVGRVLGDRGILVDHVRGDGSLQSESELIAAERVQPGLFDDIEAPAWKSIPSVSLKRRHASSSAF